MAPRFLFGSYVVSRSWAFFAQIYLENMPLCCDLLEITQEPSFFCNYKFVPKRVVGFGGRVCGGKNKDEL
jgi:hypothetical protein